MKSSLLIVLALCASLSARAENDEAKFIGAGAAHGAKPVLVATDVVNEKDVAAAEWRVTGLGVFTAKLGVREDKEMDNFEEGTTKRNAQSIEVTGVAYRADKNLIREIDQNCDLKRGGEERLKKPKFSQEERIERARQFLKKNGFMHVDEYASLTGLSYSTASRELRAIAADPASGIISQGNKSSKLYLLAKKA